MRGLPCVPCPVLMGLGLGLRSALAFRLGQRPARQGIYEVTKLEQKLMAFDAIVRTQHTMPVVGTTAASSTYAVGADHLLPCPLQLAWDL